MRGVQQAEQGLTGLFFPPRRQGLAASPSGYGPLTELPDWSYAGELRTRCPCASLLQAAGRGGVGRRGPCLAQFLGRGVWEKKLSCLFLSSKLRLRKIKIERIGLVSGMSRR